MKKIHDPKESGKRRRGIATSGKAPTRTAVSLLSGVALLIASGLTLLWLLPETGEGETRFPTTPPLEIVTKIVEIVPTAETDPVPSKGDAADDPAIWVHPDDPSESTIIVTDKKRGLGVYDLSGRELQFLPDGRMGNVDIRRDFPLGGRSIDLVLTTDREDDTIVAYAVDVATRTLESVTGQVLRTGISGYGSCMFRSPATGKYYLLVNSKKGQVEQWELYDDGNGAVAGQLARAFDVGSQTEGCVADDQLAHFYIGEENVGIWKYEAEPDGGTTRQLVDSTDSGGYLTKDVEGLTIYYGPDGTGYLIASSQGSSEFVVYRREESNEYVMTFAIVEGNGFDEVTHSDGIDVASSNLGRAFPKGVFVVQDSKNNDSNQNFKLVSWHKVESALATRQIP